MAAASGSVDSHAFVVGASASAPAPTSYTADNGAKATLFAFQPRKGIDPGEWSGFQLTGGSVFSDSQHPLVAGTNLDPSIRDFMSAYPLRWDGLMQLRIYYTAPNKVVSRRTYPAAVLRVSGNTWTMVQGATNLSCDLSKVVSSERLLLPAADFDPNHPAVTHAPAPAGAASSVTGTATAAASAHAGSSSSTPSASAAARSLAPATSAIADASSTTGKSSSLKYWVVGALVGLVLLAAAGARWIRVARR